jgi:3-isopropylmalate dehydrogenase
MKFNIAVLPGDGIGPEVMAQAIKSLDAVAERFGHEFNFAEGAVGAVAIDKTGNPLPQATLDLCLKSDAILFGAIGHPRYDNDPSAKVRPEQGLLALRKSLGLFANIRPVSTYESLLHLSPLKEERIKGADFVVYRELTGGIYFGEKGTNADRTEAFDNCTYSVTEITRIAHLAFEAAKTRGGKLTLVDKANVLETSRLWRHTVAQLATEYPEVEVDYLFVDNAAMQMILNPNRFDVVLTENMFGDILTDEASVLTGSLGLLPSASVGAETAMFEPIHGSFPEGAGLDIANPCAAILSAAMMLEHLQQFEEAAAVRSAVKTALERGIVTSDLNAEKNYGTNFVGNVIAEMIANENEFSFREENVELSMNTII